MDDTTTTATTETTEGVVAAKATPVVTNDVLIDAAAVARALLSKLLSRVEITEELRAEIDRAEEALWAALFPGAAPSTGVAGDACVAGSACGRTGCPECQQ